MGEQSDNFVVKAEAKAADDDAGVSVRARFYAPPAQFDGCFTTFYQLAIDCEDGRQVEDYLQPEWGNIRFFAHNSPRAEIDGHVSDQVPFTATGPSSRPCHFRLGKTRMWGIGFLPLGWSRFMDAPATDLTNAVSDGAAHPAFSRFAHFADVLCDPSVSSEQQLAFLEEQLSTLMQPNRDEPKITRIHTALVSGNHLAVGDLASECGMSIRTLERMCHRYFGFSPKLLMRRQRFMRSLSSFMLTRGARWTEAMDEEYHDQAQFTREFTEFMTMTPSAYAALDHPILSSFMAARARIWGSAAQTLDGPNRKDDASA